MSNSPRARVVASAGLALVLPALAVLITRGPAEAVVPGANGRIVYSSADGGADFEIWAMNPDGSDRVALTTNEVEDSDPSWSPDGRRIVYASRDGGDDLDLWVMNADGSGQTPLTHNSGQDERTPAWSPDGTKIAYTSGLSSGGFRRIRIMNPDGTGDSSLGGYLNSVERDPSWSPDGTKIVYSAYPGVERDNEIYVMEADGSDRLRLTYNVVWDRYPSWSPDGTQIVFSRADDDDLEIWMMNADGSETIPLTINDTDDQSPSWSPSGQFVAYAGKEDGDYDLRVLEVDGDGAGPVVTVNNVDDLTPDWGVAKPMSDFTMAPTPAISGTPHVGSTLTAMEGTWVPVQDSFGYVWTANGAAIDGATSRTYILTAVELAKTIAVEVTARRTGYNDTARTSAATAPVAAPVVLRSFSAAPTPKISGTPKIGVTLTAIPGTWSPKPALTYRWLANGVAVSGATKPTYVVGAAAAGKTIQVRVTGTRTGYKTTAKTSAKTKTVPYLVFSKSPIPRITGTVKVGSKLTANKGTWSPSTGVTFRYRWYANKSAISGATASTLILNDSVRGKKILVKLTASKTGYRALTRSSAETGTVAR